jgi:transposase InsO family protein
VRPWLTSVLDDHSRAVARYTVFLGTPSALQTSLALRQAIWRKADPEWPVCGIPDVLFVDHGSDFASRHHEQAAAALRFEDSAEDFASLIAEVTGETGRAALSSFPCRSLVPRSSLLSRVHRTITSPFMKGWGPQ